ncbi:MAG TPA: molybdopterin-dependent oxidoreductase [Terriglobia bacterium]|nr:molybdopterin-dependent oxidoreductase [Terriglobia bacterium]
MAATVSRREMIRSGAVFASASAMALMSGTLPALAQGEEVIAWTDQPAGGGRGGPGLDTRTVEPSAFITSTDNFYLVQHYTQPNTAPNVDPATFKLRLTGLVNKPMELSLAQLKQRPRLEYIAGFECGGSGNSNFNRLCGNAKWAGTSLSALLKDAGFKAQAREVVFFGIDKGMETVTHGRGVQNMQVEQHFGRSMTTDDAMNQDILICWEMNGAPLEPRHGFPIRLVVPGWYGVSNVKWLDHIHVQDTRFIGRFMARDYVTLTSEEIDGETIWKETLVSRIRIKSVIGRLTRTGSRYTAHGFVLNDGTPLKSVEVRVDEGPWQPAKLSSSNTKYSWKLFSYEWNNLAPGAHTIVSRATDVNGVTQPLEADLAGKKTMWENNGQFVRKFTV